jgi:Fe-S-cluster-containing hydrogenase component 2
MAYKVNPNMCMGFGACGACAKVCPVMAISEEAGKSKIDPKKCISCGSCSTVCPMGAIAVDM